MNDHTSDTHIRIVFIIGILLIAANLRAPMIAIGPLLPTIQDQLLLSNAMLGSVTTIPLLLFALLSPFAPRLAVRFGMERVVLAALCMIAIGTFLRIAPSFTFLISGTAFIGIGIAIGNVLLPGIIKQHFPHSIGLMTGIYAITMNLAAAVASGIAEPLASRSLNWNGALGVFGLLAVLAAAMWGLYMWQNKSSHSVARQPSSFRSNGMLRSPLTWCVTIFMGIQSLQYYTTMTWLPQMLQESGYSPASAGVMLALMQTAIVPMTFIIPVLAGKLKDQRWLGAFVGITFLLAISLFYLELWLPLAAIIMGIACGSGFGLAMMLFALRTHSGNEASTLSGLAQSVGYLLAAFGPIAFGMLYDIAGQWQSPLIVLLLLSIMLTIVGYISGKGYVTKEDNS
nr:MFS transporter [Geomicrobium sediminis]